MWEAVKALVESLPSWYLMVMIPILLVVGIWVFSHLKRDKQGKLYWFSQIYEQKKQSRKLDAILVTISDHSGSIKNLENKVDGFVQDSEVTQMFILKATIANEQLPDNERMQAYDEYKRRNGNSWVDVYWRDQLPKMQKRMKKRLNEENSGLRGDRTSRISPRINERY